MLEAVSALEGQVSQGIANISDEGPQGMISIRGDLSDASFVKALKSVVGVKIPAQREVSFGKEYALLWMASDELMLLCTYKEAPELSRKLEEALADFHALVVEMSDARCRIKVEGSGARDVLGKLMPVDFSREAFAKGRIRRSRLAQVPAAVWCAGVDQFHVMAFRSVAVYVFDALGVASKEATQVGVY